MIPSNSWVLGVCVCVFVCVLNHVHWEQQTGDWDICEVGYAEVFVRTLNTNKDINTHTRAHIDTKERGEEKKKRMKPLTINFTACWDLRPGEKSSSQAQYHQGDCTQDQTSFTHPHKHVYTETHKSSQSHAVQMPLCHLYWTALICLPWNVLTSSGSPFSAEICTSCQANVLTADLLYNQYSWSSENDVCTTLTLLLSSQREHHMYTVA